MRKEQYYLALEHKDGTKYRVYKNGVSLREIDTRTVKYDNKRALVETIIARTSSDVDPKDIVDVVIYRKPNSNVEEYKKERGPLYKKDAAVLDTEKTIAKFELMALDRKFVREFIKSYRGIKGFRGLVGEIDAELSKNGSYIDALSNLSEKLFSTYKGARNIYLGMRKYEKTKSINPENLTVTFEDEKDLVKREELSYLTEHDRELLDISDFDHNEDISPFDAHKTK